MLIIPSPKLEANTVNALDSLLQNGTPLLALAPMQAITDLAFWKLLQRYGGPDVVYTEYFRVYATAKVDKRLLRSITQNSTGWPVIAQLAGEDIPALVRIAQALEGYPVAAIDLNLGCPAPIVCRKKVGGALLRDLPKVDAILGALRDAIRKKFTVKTRIGYANADDFDRLLALFAKHGVDLVTVHGRTVKSGYAGEVRYDCIARAAAVLACPVVANGDIQSAPQAQAILQQTGARGLMIGRGAIRNPWLFAQIRRQLEGEPVDLPTGRDVLAYVQELVAAVRPPQIPEHAHVKKMKKYLNFIGLGIESSAQFLHQIQRASTQAEFARICEAFLDHPHPMPLVSPGAVILPRGAE